MRLEDIELTEAVTGEAILSPGHYGWFSDHPRAPGDDPQPVPCDACAGAGSVKVEGGGRGPCPACRGEGVTESAMTTCPDCDGTKSENYNAGRTIQRRPCSNCNGVGEVPV